MEDEIAALGVPEDERAAFWSVVRENIARRSDMAGWWDLMVNGANPDIPEDDRAFVAEALALLPPQPWTDATWGEWTATVKNATGRKGAALFKPLRLVLTGRATGPGMGDLMPLLRKAPNA